MILDKSDPLFPVIVNGVDRVDGKVYPNLLAWKFATIKNPSTINAKYTGFYKIQKSNYLLFGELVSGCRLTVYTVWDLSKNKGVILDDWFNVDMKNLDYTSYSIQNITDINNDIFDGNGKSFDDRAFEILKSLSTSRDHATKAPEELAIKAIKLASAFSYQLEQFKELSKSPV